MATASTAALKTSIEAAWEARDGVTSTTRGEVRDAVTTALDLLDKGQARVAEKTAEGWVVNQWLKKAVLLSFRLNDNGVMQGGWFDKVPLKFADWDDGQFRDRSGLLPTPVR